jgi:hypothetical protein
MEFKKQTSLIPYFEGFRQQLFNSQVERLLMKKALNRGKKFVFQWLTQKLLRNEI